MFQKVASPEPKITKPFLNNNNDKEIDNINTINNYVTTNVDNKKVIKRKRGLGYYNFNNNNNYYNNIIIRSKIMRILFMW